MKLFYLRFKHFLFLIDQQIKNLPLVIKGHVAYGKVTANGGKLVTKNGKTLKLVDFGYYTLDENIKSNNKDYLDYLNSKKEYLSFKHNKNI